MMLLPAFTHTKRADTSTLENKILCCDALELLRQLPDSCVDMVLADLPYGIQSYGWDVIIPLTPMWDELHRIAKDKAALVFTANEPFASMLRMTNLKHFRYDWIWKKSNATRFLDANRMPLLQHESILVFGKKLPNYYPQMTGGKPYKGRRVGRIDYVFDKKVVRINKDNDGFRYPQTVIESPYAQSIKTHPNEKPVSLFEYLIKTYTQQGDLVIDMTCGSGTTAVAARKTDRRFICGDLSHEYVELAKRRLMNSDPFQHKDMGNGEKQLSLFAVEAQ